MSRPNIFIPTNQQQQTVQTPKPTPAIVVIIENIMTVITQALVIFSIGLVPLLFIPGSVVGLSFDRMVLVSILTATAVVGGLVLLLFKRRLTTVAPLSILFLLLFVIWGFISAYASGDSFDSIWGSQLEQLTVVFSGLLVVSVMVPLLLQSSTKMFVRALSLIGLVSVVVLVHSALRYWFGMSLDFGQLTTASQSLVGGFNDSAIYAGLVVVLGLTTVIMLPLRTYAQVALGALILLAFSLLFLVMFTFVWYAILLTSVVTTGYVFLRKVLFQNTTVAPISGLTKIISVITLVLSIAGVWYGSSIANSINTATDTQFLEVRPSFEASIDIIREVYEDSVWFGVGPNRYADAWRVHKDLDINQGIFWNTDFQTGHSYVLSVFTTYGLVGGLLLVLFHIFFVWFGLSRVLSGVNENIFARYVATLVFVGAVFLWVMSYVYTPSTTLLLLAASLTGLMFAASAMLQNTKLVTTPVISNRIRGFVTLFLSIVIIAGSIAVVDLILDAHNEQRNYAEASDSRNDEVIGLIAVDRINEFNQLIASGNPESITQDQLLEVSRTALTASRQAVALDPTNPVHHERLASLYSVLGAIGVDGGYESAKETLKTVIELDPKNPKHHLALARVNLAAEDLDAADDALDTAIDLKFNYTEALQLQAEIAIANDEIEEAIAQIESVAQLEPGNPTRWYQLGLLHAAASDTESSITVLLRAIQIDPSYADARYVLALQYLAEERRDEALSQLRIIAVNNSENSQLQSLITSIENGDEIQLFEDDPDFNQPEPIVDSESGIGVPSNIPSDLVAPVNTGESVDEL